MRALITLTLLTSLVVPTWAASTWTSVIIRVQQSLVKVSAESGVENSFCTAFSINRSKRLYLTALHCLGNTTKIEGENVKTIFVDLNTDLAVIEGPSPKQHLPAS